MDTFLFIIIISIIILGVLGTVIPLLPGLPLVFAAIFLYAIITHFQVITVTNVIVYFILAVLGMGIDFFAGTYGAKRFGASKFGIIGSILGLMAGLITLGPVGLILGPLFGSVIGELFTGKSFNKAVKIGVGSLIGFLGGAVAQLLISLIMAGTFIFKTFFS